MNTPNRKAAIEILTRYCQALSAIETELDLEATREKASRELNRLTELADWCPLGEYQGVSKQSENARRVLMIVEGIQRVLKEFKQGIE